MKNFSKATLNVMESDSSRQVQNQYIFSAALSQSKAKFNRYGFFQFKIEKKLG